LVIAERLLCSGGGASFEVVEVSAKAERGHITVEEGIVVPEVLVSRENES
jgi:hypothetical protein